MSTHTTLPASPSLHDGFSGARDAATLEKYDFDREISVCHVQATAQTKPLLRRAGFTRLRTHAFYPVPVILDQFNRLQIEPRYAIA